MLKYPVRTGSAISLAGAICVGVLDQDELANRQSIRFANDL